MIKSLKSHKRHTWAWHIQFVLKKQCILTQWLCLWTAAWWELWSAVLIFGYRWHRASSANNWSPSYFPSLGAKCVNECFYFPKLKPLMENMPQLTLNRSHNNQLDEPDQHQTKVGVIYWLIWKKLDWNCHYIIEKGAFTPNHLSRDRLKKASMWENVQFE